MEIVDTRKKRKKYQKSQPEQVIDKLLKCNDWYQIYTGLKEACRAVLWEHSESIRGSAGSSRYANYFWRDISILFWETWTKRGVWVRRARRDISVTGLDCLSTIFSQADKNKAAIHLWSAKYAEDSPFPYTIPCFKNKNLFCQLPRRWSHWGTQLLWSMGFRFIPRTKGWTGISQESKCAYRNDSQQTTS